MNGGVIALLAEDAEHGPSRHEFGPAKPHELKAHKGRVHTDTLWSRLGTRAFGGRRCLLIVAAAVALGASMGAGQVAAAPPTDPPTTTVAPPASTTPPTTLPTVPLVPVQGTIRAIPDAAHAGLPYTVSGDICGTGWTITTFMVLTGGGGPRMPPYPAYPWGTIPDGMVQTATGFSFTRTAASGPTDYLSVLCDDGVTQVSAQTSVPVFSADGTPRWSLVSTTHDPDPIYFYDVVPGTDAHVVIESGDCLVGTPATVTFASANGTTVGASQTMLSYQGRSSASTAEFVVPISRTFGATGDSFTMTFACSTAAGPSTYSVTSTLGATMAPSSGQLPGTGNPGGTAGLLVAGLVLIGLGVAASLVSKRTRAR